MKTQTFKAKDVKSAINLVNSEFGDRAIILSTKKIMVLLRLKHQITMKLFLIIKKIEERKNFSNVFLKELKRKNQTNE